MKNKDKILIGVYGASGSGKSSFCKLLSTELGFKIIDLDKLGHEVLEESVVEIANAFPSVLENEKINRKKLGKIVFSNEAKLARLEAISHPRIDEKIKQNLSFTEGVILIDGAIIHKSEIKNNIDLLVLISCDRIIRVERLIKKRNISYEKAEKMADLFDAKDYDILVDTSLGLDLIKNELIELFSRYNTYFKK